MKTILLITLMLFLACPAHSIKYPIDCYTKDGYVAAISEKYLDDMIKYSVDKDYEAINKLFAAGVIVTMKDGIRVHVVETHAFSGKVEFRLPGSTDVLWTITKALKC